MFNSKFALWVVPLVFSSLMLQAQVMNEADEQRAREMLRQKIAEARAQESAPALAEPEPARSSVWERARSALRRAFTSDAAAAKTIEASPSPSPSPAPAPAAAEPSGTAEKVSESPAALPQQGQRAPETPASGPKTKQQRLVELLEHYKAGQIGPIEYHEQRARILAEP